MDKFTNRALCANYKKVSKLACCWLAQVRVQLPTGVESNLHSVEPNPWRCHGFVRDTVSSYERYGGKVLFSGIFACVPCEVPDYHTAWSF